MSPLKRYIFKHKISLNIEPITISIYGDSNQAWKVLSNYVISIKDWELIN